jgi:ribosomal protein S27AE
MKYLIAISKNLGLMIIVLSGTVLMLYFLDQKSWWALPAFIGAVVVPIGYLRLIQKKKCPRCGGKGVPTSVAGSQYKQWHCTNCERTFWTTLFLEDYEISRYER